MTLRTHPVLSLLLAGALGGSAPLAGPGTPASPSPASSPERHVHAHVHAAAPAMGRGEGHDAAARWGGIGHQMAARAALETLPRGTGGIPDFFLEAGDQLVWLNPEPDRWRDQRFPEMDEKWRYDHYIDLENIPDPAILDEAMNRWDFFERLLEAGVENPKVRVGFAPFAVLELHQRLTAGFMRWRAEEDPAVRSWLAARIVEDAGVLGHFVTDLSQPHHTTIHFNGWDEEQVPNPEGYDAEPGIHSRFESRFVQTHIEYDQVLPEVGETVRVFDDVRASVLAYVRASNDRVERLYQVDRDHGFGPETPPDPVSVDFAVERLAAGAEMLRDLWWTAWMASAPQPPSPS